MYLCKILFKLREKKILRNLIHVLFLQTWRMPKIQVNDSLETLQKIVFNLINSVLSTLNIQGDLPETPVNVGWTCSVWRHWW